MTTEKLSTMVLALLIVVGFIAVCLSMFFLPPIAQEMKELAMLLLGVLAGAFTTTVNYHMGSSSGSQKKDELLASSVQIPGGASISATSTLSPPKVP